MSLGLWGYTPPKGTPKCCYNCVLVYPPMKENGCCCCCAGGSPGVRSEDVVLLRWGGCTPCWDDLDTAAGVGGPPPGFVRLAAVHPLASVSEKQMDGQR